MVDSSGETRKCQKCGSDKNGFYAGQGNTCKECVKSAVKRNRKLNPLKYRASRRRRNRNNAQLPIIRRKQRFKRRYGLSQDKVLELLEKQNYECAICHVELQNPFELDEDEDKALPIVDHDHRDGHVRGLLCSACNTGLGQFEDNPHFVRNAYYYLKEDRESVKQQRREAPKPADDVELFD